MRSVPVVVVGEGEQHALEVSPVRDQQPVQALSAHRADEALGDRVGLRRFDGCPYDLDPVAAEDLVEGAAELGVVVADQEACSRSGVLQVPDEVPRLLGDPGTIRVPLIPPRCTRRLETSMKKST